MSFYKIIMINIIFTSLGCTCFGMQGHSTSERSFLLNSYSTDFFHNQVKDDYYLIGVNQSNIAATAYNYCTKKEAPLNVLFIVNHFPSRSQAFIMNIIVGLIKKGHNVSIFSFNKDNYASLYPDIAKYNLLDKVTYRGKFPNKLPHCDIVFCQFGTLGKKIFDAKNLKKWLKNKKVVTCFRGSDTSKYLKFNYSDVYKKLFAKGALFLPVCDYFKKRLIKLGCDPKKIVVHHSAIDCDRFSFKERNKPESNAINCATTCRLVKKKGVDDIIKAFAMVIHQYPDAHLTIMGDGPERLALENLAKKLGCGDKITFSGWACQEKVVSVLDKSHIFLLPSKKDKEGNEEGIPNALKEAMAMGLISIGTFHAGNAELIENGISGFLIKEGDYQGLAQKMYYIIEHPEIWQSMQHAARKKIETDFEINGAIAELEQIFYSLIK